MDKFLKTVRFYQLYYFDRIKKFFGGQLGYNDLLYMATKSIAFRFGGETDPLIQYVYILNLLRQDKTMKKGLELGGGVFHIITNQVSNRKRLPYNID
jgi:hypothetical protein